MQCQRGNLYAPSRTLSKSYLKLPQETGHKLVDLQDTDVLPNARSRPGSELEHGRPHFLELIRVCLDPAFRTESVDVVAEDCLGWVEYPSVAADNSATGNTLTADDGALSWYVTF